MRPGSETGRQGRTERDSVDVVDVAARDRWVPGPEVAPCPRSLRGRDRIPPVWRAARGNGAGAIPPPRSVPTQRNPQSWTDDPWFLDHDDRTVYPKRGLMGRRLAAVSAGNLGTLHLLQGTGYMPSLAGALLMIEDDAISDTDTFRPEPDLPSVAP